MRINPMKGANDYLPNEVEIRDYLQSTILEVYQNNGFERIATPIMEDIENLDNSDGGDNLNLIFKVLKRGDKLTKSLESGEFNKLADLGLRYDLTLPLTRYYANNRSKLNKPFKVIQIGDVFRAEQPQKGRLRQFIQCDIDMIGTSEISSEVELIDVIGKALLKIGINNFKVKINDRRILKDMVMSAGFTEDQFSSVCITFDKQDKIGTAGVIAELNAKGFDPISIAKFENLIKDGTITLDRAKDFCVNKIFAANMQKIIDMSNELAEGKFTTVFDMSLVRGQGYYTGTVFEVESLDFGSSIAGGGRYDNLVGKFLGEEIPAVGFSIGFERIFSIFRDKGIKIPARKKKFAVIYSEEEIVEAIKYADSIRNIYDVTLFGKVNKMGKLFSKLEESGYTGCYIMGDKNQKIFNA